MGVFSKLKNIFYDEIEVEEENEVEKELESVNRVVIKDDDEPKIEKIKTRIEEELNKKAVITEEEKETINNERELFRSERTFNFTEFDDEEPELPPRKNVLTETRVSAPAEVKQEVKVEKPKVFKPTPIISPIYGILDKDYKKEEIRMRQEATKEQVYKTKSSIDTYETVRRKAYGTLEDELEDTLNSLTTDEIRDRVAPQAEKATKIEDLISKIEEVSDELDKTMSIAEIEDNIELDNFETEETPQREEIVTPEPEEEKEENLDDKTMTDSTLEHDLFNLIDSMYDE